MGRLTVKLVVLVSIVVLIDHAAASFLKRGMDKRFKIDRDAAVLCIGNSHTRDGIDEELLERGLGVSVAKYSYRGVNTFDRLAMIRHYASEHPGALRLVVYDVDDHTFTSKQHESKTYTNLYPYIGNPEIGRHVKECAGSWGEFISRKYLWMLRYTPDLRNFALAAYTRKRGSTFTKTVNIAEIARDIAREGKEYGVIKIEPDNVRCLEETIRFVRSQGALLAFVYIPVMDLWSAVGGRDGQRQAVAMFEHYASHDSGVMFLNYKEAYEHRRELYYDRAHMNIKGKELLTRALLHDIRPYAEPTQLHSTY